MPSSVSSRRLITVAFLVFVALGLSAGVLGVAWPSMRGDLSRPLSDLGVLLAISTGGYFLAGLVAGRLTDRIGIGNLLTATMTLGTVSLVGYAVAQSWPLLLIASIGLGLTGGMIDSVINAYVALQHGTRTMNLLHASFGVGATVGPILVASTLARGLSWRTAFLILAVAELVLLVTVAVVRGRWPVAAQEQESAASQSHVGGPVFGLLGLFFLYVGLEFAAGQWSYSLLTEGRGVGEFVAGLWVAAYWGGLTGGRLILGVLGDRIGSGTTLRLSMVGTILGCALFWWDPAGLGVAGLPLAGVSLAGIFPTLVALTPSWVGKERAPTVIGYQIAASSVGAASIPWIAGLVIESAGLESLGPFLVATAILMAGLHLVVARSVGGGGQRRSMQFRSPFSRATTDRNSSQS